MSPKLKLGLALTGNFGAPLNYDDNWVGRYYVQETTMLGLSFLPSIAYKVTDKLSLGASLNAMYGIYKNQVAINIPDAQRPGISCRFAGGTDAQLKLDDNTWGWGVNLGAALRVQPRHAARAHLELAGRPRLQRAGGVLEPRQLGTTAPERAGCSTRTSTWASRSRSR